MKPKTAELRVLRQVHKGSITIHNGGYIHGAHPVTGEPAEALVRLHTAGCIAVGAPGPSGHRPVQTTPAGQARLAELDRREHDD